MPTTEKTDPIAAITEARAAARQAEQDQRDAAFADYRKLLLAYVETDTLTKAQNERFTAVADQLELTDEQIVGDIDVVRRWHRDKQLAPQAEVLDRQACDARAAAGAFGAETDQLAEQAAAKVRSDRQGEQGKLTAEADRLDQESGEAAVAARRLTAFERQHWNILGLPDPAPQIAAEKEAAQLRERTRVLLWPSPPVGSMPERVATGAGDHVPALNVARVLDNRRMPNGIDPTELHFAPAAKQDADEAEDAAAAVLAAYANPRRDILVVGNRVPGHFSTLVFVAPADARRHVDAVGPYSSSTLFVRGPGVTRQQFEQAVTTLTTDDAPTPSIPTHA